MSDHETIFDRGDGGVAAMVAGLLAVALVVIGFFYYSGIERTGRTETIEIVAPVVSADGAPAGQ